MPMTVANVRFREGFCCKLLACPHRVETTLLRDAPEDLNAVAQAADGFISDASLTFAASVVSSTGSRQLSATPSYGATSHSLNQPLNSHGKPNAMLAFVKHVDERAFRLIWNPKLVFGAPEQEMSL
jgi:hypothetical protein